jgi:hypothetical protein
MDRISRRDFIKIGLLGAGALAFMPKPSRYFSINRSITDFPTGKNLGRVFKLAEIKSKPDANSSTVGKVYQDNVVEWLREVIGTAPSLGSTNRRWVETPDGYIPSIQLQPVQALLNTPLTTLPHYASGDGFWAEVTVPYVDLVLDNPPAKSPLLKDTPDLKFYYSQVFWVDGIKTDENGNALYHVIEKHGSHGDMFWADARAFRPITEEEVAPISPNVTDKKVVVDLTHQSLSCYEGNNEVLYSRVSTGAKFTDVGASTQAYATPTGLYNAITTKYISVHMEGGSAASGYELFGVNWTCIFHTGGVALHSTFWHNNYGEPMSHGCVNINPDDAKFIYRWTLPSVDYESGKIEQTGYSGTNVQVIEDTF